jgi:hypothetical protein
MYGQVLGQYNRHNKCCSANVGGVKETYKAYGQDGAVYARPRDKARTRDDIPTRAIV